MTKLTHIILILFIICISIFTNILDVDNYNINNKLTISNNLVSDKVEPLVITYSKINYNKILTKKPKLINPIKSIVTNIIQTECFPTDTCVDNLLNLIISAYNEGINKLQLDKQYIFLLYRGGNIIESNIINLISKLKHNNVDLFKKNNINMYDDINETGLLDKKDNEFFFDKNVGLNRVFKSSDIDLCIYVDYCSILGINKKTIKEQVLTIWTEKMNEYIILLDKISQLSIYILNRVCDNLDKSLKNPINFPLLKINKRYIDEIKSEFDKIKITTLQLVQNKSLTDDEYTYLNDTNPYYIGQILDKKKLKDSFNKGFDKINNSIEFIGIGYNRKNIEYIKDTDIITDDNCVSYNMLLQINNNAELYLQDTIDSGMKDEEVYYCSNYEKATINDSIFYNDFKFGSKIKGIINNKIVEINNKAKRETSKKTNNYYISSNYTTRTSYKYVKDLYNLHEIKYNFKFYFGLPNSLICKNKEIKFFYIDIPAEVIDIVIRCVGDFDMFYMLNNQKKTITNLSNVNGDIKTPTIYALIFNLCKMLFYQTNFCPWNDIKYEKRLDRLLQLTIYNLLTETIKNNQSKKYSEDILFILQKIILIKKTKSKFTTKILYSHIKNINDKSFKTVIKCITYTIYSNLNDTENLNKFIDIIINILNKFIDFNLVNDI